MSKVTGQSIAFIIIAVNIILKIVIIQLVIWIGEDTSSKQKSSITNKVFMAQFFNTGFLILIVNANLTEHEPVQFTRYFNGPFYDYQPDWFQDVGLKILQTMIINCVMPYVNVVVAFLVPNLLRYLDNGFTGNPYNTKKTSIQTFKQLYTGADYLIHFKYSDALNITYITMMYGLGMPLLFPIAAIAMFSQWLSERIQIAYTVRQPPAMDNQLSNNAID